MDAVSSILDRLVDERLVSAGSMRGCSDSDIEQIMADQHVSRLPSAYLCYLRRIGRGGGGFLAGTDAFFPEIIGLKDDARELFAERGVTIEFSPEAFVIAMHQGYQVFWFPTVMDDDPEVMMFQEGDQYPSTKWWTFTSYLNDMVESLASAKAIRARRLANRGRDDGRGHERSPGEVLHRFGTAEGRALGLRLLRTAIQRRDARNVKMAMILGFKFGFTMDYLELLIQLCSADWHHSHEDVVSALGDLCSPRAVDVLYQMTQWVPEYLDFDESRALATKAICALGNTPGPEAEQALRRLLTSGSEIVREGAREQFKRRDEDRS